MTCVLNTNDTALRVLPVAGVNEYAVPTPRSSIARLMNSHLASLLVTNILTAPCCTSQVADVDDDEEADDNRPDADLRTTTLVG